MTKRTFTVDEANRLVPLLGPLVERAQTVTTEMRDVRDQLVDLRIVWGDQVETASCPDHAEYAGYRDRFAQLERDLRVAMKDLEAHGAVIKDVEAGLVDFYAAPDGEAFLCWRKGEKNVGFWHALDAGYSSRQPLETL